MSTTPASAQPRISEPRFSVVFLLGVAHCGSTLLGRTLGMHSQVHCVGELLRVSEALEAKLPCGCGAQLRQCPHWAPLLPGLEQATRLDYERFDRGTLEEFARRAGKSIAFDLSKTRAWRLAKGWRDPAVGFVHLVRDSRGVMSSTVRAGTDLGRPLGKHVKWSKRLSKFARKNPKRCHTLHYEDLCTDPRRELEKLCAFLGIVFEPTLLRPADAVHHFVHSSASGYLKGSNEIALDERWRRELTAEQIEAIEKKMRKIPELAERYLAVTAR
jgi:Sulfotransferase family